MDADYPINARIGVTAQQVIHEIIDGEVIIINLGTGTYYSLKGSAAHIWELIQQPAGVHRLDLIEALAARFESSHSELEAAVTPFLAELGNEGLVTWTEQAPGRGPDAAPVASNGHEGERYGFTPPALEKFTDMQDLVLLDPVHEVDQTGWPRVPSSAAPDGASA